MKKFLLALAFIAAMVLSPQVLISCGGDEPEGTEGTETPNNPDNEQLVLDEESLIGTWRYTASNYGNTDYIAFNGHGIGMMAMAADQFSNSGQAHNDAGTFELVTFKYNIENNIIYIMPDRNHIKDFIITVFDVQRTSLDLLFDLDTPARRKKMNLYQDDWEWFTKEGPASVDLTGSFPGNYVVDSDPIHKIQITRINNYTLKIKDIYKNTEVTGVLYWSSIYGPYKNGEITLWNPNDNMGAGYWFTSDGKLHSQAGSHYFSGGASKTDDSSTSDDRQLLGTWVGKDYDDTFIISFFSNGTAKEIWTDGEDKETISGTYSYSNGKITKWLEGKGSILENTIGDCPWSVVFESSTKMTLISGYSTITFTKK